MGNQLSCVSGSSDSPKTKGKGKPTLGIPSSCSKPRVVRETENSITISWDKPVHDGGNSIFAYAIKMSRDGQSAWRKLTAECDECLYEAKDLESNTAYKFFVQAENDNGLSKPSEISDPIKTLAEKIVTQPVVADTDLVDGTTVTLGDENENEAKAKGEMKVSDFGPSAEKYVKDEKDEKATSSSEDGDERLPVNVEVKDESKGSNDAGEGHVGQKIEKDGKDTPESNDGKRIAAKSESKEKLKRVSSSSSSSSDHEMEKSDGMPDKFLAEATSELDSSPSNAKDDFHGDGPSVEAGTMQSFLDSRLYQYSNDSLLEEDQGGESDVTTKNRVNRSIDLQQHDNRYFIEIEAVGADTSGAEEECSSPPNRDTFGTLPVPPLVHSIDDYDMDQSNRLSIISEKSMEDNLSPDASSKDGQHFVFSKKLNQNNSNSKLEMQVNSAIGQSKIPNFTSKIPGRRPSNENSMPLRNEVEKSVSVSKIPAASGTKIQKPSDTSYSSQNGKPEIGGKNKIPSPAGRSQIPSFGANFSIRAADSDSDRDSPRDGSEPRRSSIPTIVPSRGSVTNESHGAKPISSSIPRRGSGTKSSIPIGHLLKRDSSDDSVNQMDTNKLSSGMNSESSSGDDTHADSKVLSGIPRKKSFEKPESGSKMNGPGTKMGTGIPRASSGIRPPGSFGFQARIDTSS